MSAGVIGVVIGLLFGFGGGVFFGVAIGLEKAEGLWLDGLKGLPGGMTFTVDEIREILGEKND